MTREEITTKRSLIKAQVKHVCDLILAIEKSLKELPDDERERLEDEVELMLAKV